MRMYLTKLERQRRQQDFLLAAVWDVLMLVVLSAIILSACGFARAATVLDASVIVRCQDRDGSISGGSGTVIDSRDGYSLVLSCGHVFRDAAGTSVNVSLHDGRVVVGKLIKRSDEPDLALVSVPITSPAYSPLAAGDVSQQQATVTIGLFGVKAGLVRTVNRYAGLPNFTVARQSTEGDSGGGVFNDRGELIGVHWGGSNGEAFAVGLPAVRSFLASVEVRQQGCRRAA